MAQKRVQIVVMESGAARWKFIAHGAPFERDFADPFKVEREARGDKVRFLAIGKESNND